MPNSFSDIGNWDAVDEAAIETAFVLHTDKPDTPGEATIIESYRLSEDSLMLKFA